jgi:hypothetical protein
LSAHVRNVLLVVVAFVGCLWVLHMESVERQMKRDREAAFRKECKNQGGEWLIGCSDYCVKFGSVLAVGP